MLDTIQDIVVNVKDLIYTIGPAAGIFVIILESIIPILPLGAFIALNNIVFGPYLGFLISWVATIMGCLVSFYAFRLGFSKRLYRNIKVDGKIHKFMHYISKMEFSKLVLLVALPFSPAFLINIASGLSKMDEKKYLTSIIIGKISIVYFWGYIGTSFMESLKNPIILLRIVILIALAYFISQFIQKLLEKKGGKKWSIL
jgi:uncharacterized membrane protein YdjX (TVP38/TMEM64 family)